MATFNIATKNQYISGYVQVDETFASDYITTNKSTVTVIAYLRRTNTYTGTPTNYNGTGMTRTIIIDGETFQSTASVSITIPNNNSYVEIYRASKEITHNSDGSKSIQVSFKLANNRSNNSFTVDQTSSTIALTKIARYTSVSQSLNSKTETKIIMNWSTTDVVDYIWYSINNGQSWVGVGSTNATSGQYIISGLSPNTTYNVKTRARRKDSQLNSDYSSYSSITTYDYPKITSAPDFIIGNENTITFTNPRNLQCSLYFIGDNGYTLGASSISGTQWVGFNNENWQRNLYNSIAKKSGKYKIKIECSEINYDKTFDGGTYSVSSSITPQVSGTIKDINPSTLNLTNDENIIVNGYSTARITPNVTKISSPYDEYATISKYNVDGIDYALPIDIYFAKKSNYNLYVTNSRDISSPIYTIYASKFIHYVVPTLEAQIDRPTQVGNEMEISFKGTSFNQYFDDAKENYNEITIKWYVRTNENDEWTLGGTFIDGVDYTVDETNNTYTSGYRPILLTNPLSNDGTWNYMKTYYFQITLEDKLNKEDNAIVFNQYVKIGQSYFDWWRVNDTNYFNVNGEYLKNGQPFDAGISTRLTTSLDNIDNAGIEKVKDIAKGIIESGSNANGNYVKYSDGTMICDVRMSMTNFTPHASYHGFTNTWSYPASFISTPRVIATANDWTTYDTTCKVYAFASGCSVMYFMFNPSSKEYNDNIYSDGSINLIAIGRWK